MPRWNTQAIVLATTDYLESDRIVIALTRDRGLIHAIAKGARRSIKRFPGTLEPFSEIQMEVFTKPGMDLLRLEEARLIDAHMGIRQDLELFAHATILIEVLLNHLGPFDPHPHTYAVLSRGLKIFCATSRWFPHWAVTMINLLASIGYGIDSKQTLEEGKPLPLRTCSPESIMFMEKGVRLEPEVLNRVALSRRACIELECYLLDICEKIAEKPLKSRAFLSYLAR